MMLPFVWKFNIVLVLVLFAFVSLTLTGTPALAEVDLPQLIQQVEPAVLFIMVYDDKGKYFASGSGFFISPEGEFITNRHVLANAYNAIAKTSDGRSYPIKKVIASHPEIDLVKGIVDNVNGPIPYLRIAKQDAVKGQRIYTFGSPAGATFTVSDGIVSALRPHSQWGEIVQFTAPAWHGSSGGPIVNQDGEVVAIVVGGTEEGQNINFAIPAHQISALYAPNTEPLVAGPQPAKSQQPAQPQPQPAQPVQPQPLLPTTPSNPQQPAKQRYLLILSNPDYNCYLDINTLTVFYNKEKNTTWVEFWLRRVYTAAGKATVIANQTKAGQGDKFYNLNMTLDQIQVKPKEKTFTLRKMVHYDTAGAVIENKDFPEKEEVIAPGTQMEKVADAVFQYISEHTKEVNGVNE
ncbi:MAG: serine protease [Negativicutes bacterium]|nr:serine protease [Negativicutes bacterium]